MAMGEPRGERMQNAEEFGMFWGVQFVELQTIDYMTMWPMWCNYVQFGTCLKNIPSNLCHRRFVSEFNGPAWSWKLNTTKNPETIFKWWVKFYYFCLFQL